jgi:opacity protein-like surface antigen
MRRTVRGACIFAIKACVCMAILVFTDSTGSLAQPKKTPTTQLKPPLVVPPGLPEDVFYSYLAKQHEIDGLLRKKCVDASSKKETLNHIKEEIEYLRRYARSSAQTPDAEKEARDYASILSAKYRELEKKAVCPPGGAAAAPPAAPAAVPACIWTKADAELEKSLSDSVEKFRQEYNDLIDKKDKIVERITELRKPPGPKESVESWQARQEEADKLETEDYKDLTKKIDDADARYESAKKQLDALREKKKKCGVSLRPTEWQGLYAGGGGGFRITDCNNWETKRVESLGIDDEVGRDNEECFSTAFRGTVYAGYNLLVSPSWLVGLETEVGIANADTTRRGIPGTAGIIVPPAFSAKDSVNVKDTWDINLRARIGYLVTPDTLLYGTFGVAWQEIEARVTCGAGICGVNPITPFSVSKSDTVTGWTGGLGVEQMISPHLALRAEYRYSDYETFTATYGSRATLGVTSDIDMRTHIGTFGLTYKF